MPWTRRQFLTVLAGGAVAACSSGDPEEAPVDVTTPEPTTPPTLPAVDHGEPVGENPFTLGVASGDPDHESVVLWTRAERPPDAGAAVTVEVALDDGFDAIIHRSEVTAEPGADMTVRVLAEDLAADTEYWYRFALDGHVTPPARTRTAPAPGQLPESMRIAHLSCQRFSSGYWTALTDVAAQQPDVVVHCGDYVYEADNGTIRPVDAVAPTDLAGYRALYRRYKQEPELQAAHAAAPWLIVWDDHEVENNYQGADPGDRPEGQEFLDQRAAAYRAWWEYVPTRVAPPEGSTMRIHRTVDWGALTRFVLLDTRQYRDDQPCPGSDMGEDLGARCDQSATTTMLGDDQEAWFDDVVEDHDARWTTVVQQVVVHQWRFLGGNVLWNLDQWDGYPGARRRFLTALGRARGPVVLSGDVHSSWIADLRADFDDPSSPTLGTEFVAPGVSSDVPRVLGQAGSLLAELSDHIHWSDTTHRGWVLHTVTPETWQAEFRLVDDATIPESPIQVGRTWTIDT